MKVHRSALKHGVLQARLLETVVLIFLSGEEMVIHAVPARRQFWDLLP